jgi:transposase
LTLSFVPDAEQRLWRTVTRKKYQLRRDVVRLHNQLEALLEEAHKLSSLVSDLLGVSARRMLKALADGETNPAALAALAHERLRATPEQLCDALGACTELKPVYRRLLKSNSKLPGTNRELRCRGGNGLSNCSATTIPYAQH